MENTVTNEAPSRLDELRKLISSSFHDGSDEALAKITEEIIGEYRLLIAPIYPQGLNIDDCYIALVE